MPEILFAPKAIFTAILVETDIIKRDAAGVFVEKVIRDTPGLTGKARTNWRVGINNSPKGVVKAGSESTALNRARRTLKRAKSKDPRKKRILIVNNVPYIRRLNSGWSQKAPALFVERAIRFAEGNSKLPRKKFI